MKILIKNRSSGFTLIEILVVIAIIGILAAAVMVSIVGAREKAQIAAAEAQVREIYNAIALLENDTECWPKGPDEAECNEVASIEAGDPGNEVWDLNNTEVGITGDNDNAFFNWDGPYMDEVALDPWGNPYFFDTDYNLDAGAGGTRWAVVIGSFGPNGEGQNLYDDDDVIHIITSE